MSSVVRVRTQVTTGEPVMQSVTVFLAPLLYGYTVLGAPPTSTTSNEPCEKLVEKAFVTGHTSNL